MRWLTNVYLFQLEMNSYSRNWNTPYNSLIVTDGYYVEVLREFRKRFRRKRPALFKSGQWHFHQDNIRVHNSILVTDYLTKMGIKIVPNPPYSAELAPCDFWLFPKLRGCRYETIEEMKEAVTKVIDTLTREHFPGAFQKYGGTVQQVHCSRGRLLRRGLEFNVCTTHTKKVWKLIVCTSYFTWLFVSSFLSFFHPSSLSLFLSLLPLPPLSLSVCLSLSLSIYIYICIYISQSVHIYLSICVSNNYLCESRKYASPNQYLTG